MKICKLGYGFFLCVDRACTYVCRLLLHKRKKQECDFRSQSIMSSELEESSRKKVERKYYSDSVISLECIKVKNYCH